MSLTVSIIFFVLYYYIIVHRFLQHVRLHMVPFKKDLNDFMYIRLHKFWSSGTPGTTQVGRSVVLDQQTRLR